MLDARGRIRAGGREVGGVERWTYSGWALRVPCAVRVEVLVGVLNFVLSNAVEGSLSILVLSLGS